MKPLPLFCLALLALAACHRESPPTTTPTTLSFSVISRQEIPGGHAADALGQPKLGFVAAQPDLTLTRLQVVIPAAAPPSTFVMDPKGVVTSGGEKSHPALLIQMLPDDAKKFQELTAHNAKGGVLATLSGKPLMALAISIPVVDGKVFFTLGERPDRWEIQNELESMVK